MLTERTDRPVVGGHCVISEEARHHRLQPSSLFGNGRVHVTTKLFLDLPELGSHAVSPCFALELEGPAPGSATDKDEAQECEGLRFAEPPLLSPYRRMAAKLQQACLFPMQVEPELLEPHAQRVPESLRIGLVLEASNDIVGIAHDDHIAGGLTTPPLLSPEIEDIVQVDIGEQRRNHAMYTKANLVSNRWRRRR